MAGGGSLGTFFERILGHPRGKMMRHSQISNAKYHFTLADKSINLNIYWVEEVERQTDRHCCRPIQHHRRPTSKAYQIFFNILSVCVFFFSIHDCDWRLFAVSVGTPAGRSSTSRLGKFFSGILWGFPILHSPIASFSLCLLLFSLTDFAFTFDSAFVFLAFVLISPVDYIGLGCEWICLDWRKFCGVVSVREGSVGGGSLGWLVATQKKSNVVVLAGIV